MTLTKEYAKALEMLSEAKENIEFLWQFVETDYLGREGQMQSKHTTLDREKLLDIKKRWKL